MKTFPVGVLLSISTGRLAAPFDEVHRFLDFMTGDTLFTHQLPRAAREAEGPLIEQFPWLADVKVPDNLDENTVWPWVASIVAEHGEWHEVQPLRAGEHARIDPFAEMAMNHPHVEVVTVEIGEVAR